MPAIDFREIPSPTAGPSRDQFELFAREFLELKGFRVLVGPDRGPDAGRDLIVEEIRTGVVGETRVTWLVSCKHKAHSGGSVTPSDEQNITDRISTHGCRGFLALYSTVPSSGLAATLNANLPFEIMIYDPEKIERDLLSSSKGLELAKRFFPLSMARWAAEHPSPANIFGEEPDLSCHYCRKSLLVPEIHGIVVVWTRRRPEGESPNEETVAVYWCCNDRCDQALAARYRHERFSDSWEDIPDLTIPIVYLRWIMSMLNELRGGDRYSDEAFDNMKKLLINLFPLVSRHMTTDEKARVQSLTMIPWYLGGMGH